jgi:hypothetical protein
LHKKCCVYLGREMSLVKEVTLFRNKIIIKIKILVVTEKKNRD